MREKPRRTLKDHIRAQAKNISHKNKYLQENEDTNWRQLYEENYRTMIQKIFQDGNNNEDTKELY